jgi:arylsulfatase A-like enzyme
MDVPVHIADWMPTFAALTGAKTETDPQWDGVDIWPLLDGTSTRAPERAIFWNFRGSQFALRDGDWKLITAEHTDPARSELFDIARDPYEKNELSARHPEVVARMLERIREERKLDGVSRRPDAPADGLRATPAAALAGAS